MRYKMTFERLSRNEDTAQQAIEDLDKEEKSKPCFRYLVAPQEEKEAFLPEALTAVHFFKDRLAAQRTFARHSVPFIFADFSRRVKSITRTLATQLTASAKVLLAEAEQFEIIGDDGQSEFLEKIKALSDDDIISLLGLHGELVETEYTRRYLPEELDQYLGKFASFEAIQQQASERVQEQDRGIEISPDFSIQIPISEDEIKKRLGRKITYRRLIPFDDIVDPVFENMGGCSFPSASMVLVKTNLMFGGNGPIALNQSAYRSKEAHEFTHVVSGLSLVDKNKDGVFEEKCGLGFFVYKTIDATNEQQVTIRFSWLNEAVTEMLGESLNGELAQEALEQPLGAYGAERELLGLLITSGSHGIPLQKFINAYFEEGDPVTTDQGKGRIPRWRELRDALNKAYSPIFLIQLDKYVLKFGAEKAVEEMRKNWHTIDNYKFK